MRSVAESNGSAVPHVIHLGQFLSLRITGDRAHGMQLHRMSGLAVPNVFHHTFVVHHRFGVRRNEQMREPTGRCRCRHRLEGLPVLKTGIGRIGKGFHETGRNMQPVLRNDAICCHINVSFDARDASMLDQQIGNFVVVKMARVNDPRLFQKNRHAERIMRSYSLKAIECSGNFLLLQPVRDVAQPGSAHVWGACGRWFESSRPDSQRLSKDSLSFFCPFFRSFPSHAFFLLDTLCFSQVFYVVSTFSFLSPA